MAKTLVAYFSASGTTAHTAKEIAQAVDENINLVKQWISESGVKAH